MIPSSPHNHTIRLNLSSWILWCVEFLFPVAFRWNFHYITSQDTYIYTKISSGELQDPSSFTYFILTHYHDYLVHFKVCTISFFFLSCFCFLRYHNKDWNQLSSAFSSEWWQPWNYWAPLASHTSSPLTLTDLLLFRKQFCAILT